MSATVIQFVPRPNPDRDKLIDQARKNYESVFPTEIANVALIGNVDVSFTAIVSTPHDTAIYESSLGFVAPSDDCA